MARPARDENGGLWTCGHLTTYRPFQVKAEMLSGNSVFAGAIVAPQKSIMASAQNVDLMEAPCLSAHLLRLALGMLKMQVQEPGIFGIGCEVVCRSQRRPAKLADGVPDFCRQLIYVLRIPRRIRNNRTATGSRRREMADETQQRTRHNAPRLSDHSAALRIDSLSASRSRWTWREQA